MKTNLTRAIVSIWTLCAASLFGAVAIPPSDISPLASGVVLGRTSAGSGPAQQLSAGTGITIANGQISAFGGGGGAPTNATYITQTANGTLTNEQPLSLLSTGLMYVTTATGVITSLGPVLPSTYGGTANAFTTFTGPAGSIKAFALPNVSAQILTSANPVTTAQGGLGVVLVDPNADRILFWDDSAGAYAYLTVGAGLSLAGTTLTATGTGTGNVTVSGTPTSGQIAEWTSATNVQGKTATGTGSVVLASGGVFSIASATGGMVPGGGTGVASFTAYAPILGGTTSTGPLQSGTVGTAGQVWTSNGAGAIPTFQTPSAGGNVTAASNFGTDNVLVKSDGTGKGVQSTGITIADTTNDVSGVGNLTVGNLTTTNLTISGSITGVMGVTNGGTGRATGTTAYSLLATGTTATGAQQTLANGATTEILVGGGASALPVWTTATGTGAPVRATATQLVLTGLTDGGVVDNAAVIQAAFPAGVTRSVVLPKGTFLINSTITMAPGSTLTGQGDGDAAGTIIIYSGTGRGVTIYAPTGAEVNYGGRISYIRFVGTAANLGLVSLSDTYRVIVEHCTFVGGTVNAGLGVGIELRNINTWTEGAELLFNQFRDVGIHYKFTIDDDTDPGHLSFAETRIRGSSNVLTGINDRVILAANKSYIYSSDIAIKANVDVNPATTPTATKAVLVELGNDAVITTGNLYLYSEIQQDRNFWRFKLGTNSYVSGFGYTSVAAATGMSSLVGATHPMDSLTSTSTLYLGPGGEFRTGAGGPARVTAGQPVFAQKAVTTSGIQQAVYLSPGTARVTLDYTGTSQRQQMTLRFSATQFDDSAPLGQGPTILDNKVFIGNPAFNAANPPYLAYTSSNNAVLCVDINNPAVDGILTVTCELESFVNSGSANDLGINRPMMPLPVGLTVGSAVNAARTVVTVGGNPATLNGELLIGNGTTGVFSKATPVAGQGVSVTTGAGSLTLGATGGYSLTVYAAGTAYTMTTSDALLDFGTTDPTKVLDQAGTYLIFGRANLKYNAATYAGTETATVHLRRTNNTAADLANGTTTTTLRVITTITDTVGAMPLPPVIYTTVNTNDSISLFGSLSAAPAAGSVDCTEASIVAIRLF